MENQLNKNRFFRQYFLTGLTPLNNYRSLPIRNVKKIDETNIIKCLPFTPYGKQAAMEITAEKSVANCKTELLVTLDEDVSLIGKDCLRFGYNANGNRDRLEVELIGETKSYVYLVSVLSERWNNILLDLSPCKHCGALKGIRFCQYGEDDKNKYDSISYIAEITLGVIFDLGFNYAQAEKYFEPQGAAIIKDNSLFLNYKQGQIIRFPTLENAEFTENKFLLYLKPILKLSYINFGKSQFFDLIILFTANGETFEKTFPIFALNNKFATKCLLIYDDELSKDSVVTSISILFKSSDGVLQIKNFGFFPSLQAPIEQEAEDFLNEPYQYSFKRATEPTKKTINAVEFGAIGNGFTDDTAVLQGALDNLYLMGGGTLILDGERDFVVTHLILKDNTNICISQRSALCQSNNCLDYDYQVSYGHDSVDAKVNWAHNFLVNNKPLIYADNAKNICISGLGEVRMMSDGRDKMEVGFPFFPNCCQGTIHVLPLGFNHCQNVVIKDISITHASSYHVFMNLCTDVALKSIRLYNATCLSADGIGLCGTKDVIIENCYVCTNDDGITLFSVQKDPRTGLWWKTEANADNSVKNIEINHCYVNSKCGGMGKAIAFIPWGTNAADMSKQSIENVYIHNCVLKGGYAIGAWADNPYNGKVPFDNTETDDFSPVFDIKLEKNVYCDPVDLLCITPTFVSSDDGALHSANQIVNGDFKFGLAYFKTIGDVVYTGKSINCETFAAAFEDLFFEAGKFKITVECIGRVNICAKTNENVYSIDSEILIFTLFQPCDIQIKITALEKVKLISVKSELIK